jgi:hypothetical protein
VEHIGFAIYLRKLSNLIQRRNVVLQLLCRNPIAIEGPSIRYNVQRPILQRAATKTSANYFGLPPLKTPGHGGRRLGVATTFGLLPKLRSKKNDRSLRSCLMRAHGAGDDSDRALDGATRPASALGGMPIGVGYGCNGVVADAVQRRSRKGAARFGKWFGRVAISANCPSTAPAMRRWLPSFLMGEGTNH